MLTPSTPVAAPLAPDSTPTARAAAVEANARADLRQQQQAGTRNDAHLAELAATARATREAATEVPDPMTSLSTIAVAGAMNSVPAALEMMRSIVLQSAAGTLSDTDRQTLHSEYAQLTAHVATTVGSVGAGEQAAASMHDQREDNTGRHGGDDRRGAPAQAKAVAREQAQHPAPEQAGTAQRPAPAPASRGPRAAPDSGLRPQQQSHAGAASNEQLPLHQPAAQAAAPATSARLDTHAGMPNGHAAQITQFVQVGQAGSPASVHVVA